MLDVGLINKVYCNLVYALWSIWNSRLEYLLRKPWKASKNGKSSQLFWILWQLSGVSLKPWTTELNWQRLFHLVDHYLIFVRQFKGGRIELLNAMRIQVKLLKIFVISIQIWRTSHFLVWIWRILLSICLMSFNL